MLSVLHKFTDLCLELYHMRFITSSRTPNKNLTIDFALFTDVQSKVADEHKSKEPIATPHKTLWPQGLPKLLDCTIGPKQQALFSASGDIFPCTRIKSIVQPCQQGYRITTKGNHLHVVEQLLTWHCARLENFQYCKWKFLVLFLSPIGNFCHDCKWKSGGNS